MAPLSQRSIAGTSVNLCHIAGQSNGLARKIHDMRQMRQAGATPDACVSWAAMEESEAGAGVDALSMLGEVLVERAHIVADALPAKPLDGVAGIGR